jgi:hypothetical protein
MAEVPPGVVTVTSTVPLPAGLVAVIWVSLLTLTLLAAVRPKETLVAPVKPVPVIVTLVPPVPGPLAGLILVTVGAGLEDGDGDGAVGVVGVGVGGVGVGVTGVGVGGVGVGVTGVTTNLTVTVAFPPLEVILIEPV